MNRHQFMCKDKKIVVIVETFSSNLLKINFLGSDLILFSLEIMSKLYLIYFRMVRCQYGVIPVFHARGEIVNSVASPGIIRYVSPGT